MAAGVDKPEILAVLVPPQALIKLKEITISNFFINISNCAYY